MEDLFILKYGGWRHTELYDELESIIIGPFRQCEYYEVSSKPLGPPKYVYEDLKHRVRHVRRQVKKLHDLHFIKWIFDSPEVEILEYLLNSKSNEIWFVPAHHRHTMIVNLITKWWRKYYDLVFGRLEAYYNIAYRLLNIIYPLGSWDHDPHIDFALEGLENYLRDLHSFNVFLDKVRRISQSNMTKREKEYWLMQLKNVMHNFYYITKEFRVQRYMKGKIVTITFYKLNLNVKEILQKTMERVEEILQDAYNKVFNHNKIEYPPIWW